MYEGRVRQEFEENTNASSKDSTWSDVMRFAKVSGTKYCSFAGTELYIKYTHCGHSQTFQQSMPRLQAFVQKVYNHGHESPRVLAVPSRT
jgi:hypothetical protein